MNRTKRLKYSILLFIILLTFTFSMGCGTKGKNSSVSENVLTSSQVANDGFGGSKSINASEFKDTKTSVSFSTAVDNSSQVTTKTPVSAENTPKADLSNRKVVMTGTMALETNKFDKAVDGISTIVKQSGGYVENSNMSGNKAANGDFLENRGANFILRIPASKFDYIISSMGSLGTIISKSTNGEDVTYQFYDNEARIKTLKVKEERILEILKKTKVMQDVLSAESELQSTIYEIENLTGTQKKLSNLVEFSTLTISVREVNDIKKLVKKPATLGERISYSFKQSIKLLVDITKGTIVVLVAILPFAVILLIVLAILWYILKRKKKS